MPLANLAMNSVMVPLSGFSSYLALEVVVGDFWIVVVEDFWVVVVRDFRIVVYY